LVGKLHLGYIFGYAVLGSYAVYLLLNLMTEQGIGMTHTMSVLGYALLPMILLGVASVFLPITFTYALSTFVIFYCTYSASSMFVSVLQMKEQQTTEQNKTSASHGCTSPTHTIDRTRCSPNHSRLIRTRTYKRMA